MQSTARCTTLPVRTVSSRCVRRWTRHMAKWTDKLSFMTRSTGATRVVQQSTSVAMPRGKGAGTRATKIKLKQLEMVAVDSVRFCFIAAVHTCAEKVIGFITVLLQRMRIPAMKSLQVCSATFRSVINGSPNGLNGDHLQLFEFVLFYSTAHVQVTAIQLLCKFCTSFAQSCREVVFCHRSLHALQYNKVSCFTVVLS